jgi:hypothetical protein
MPLSYAFLHNKAADSITPGFDVFVQEVMDAITTDPCLSSYYSPRYLKAEVVFTSYYFNPKPLNPTACVKLLFQSDLRLFNAT